MTEDELFAILDEYNVKYDFNRTEDGGLHFKFYALKKSITAWYVRIIRDWGQNCGYYFTDRTSDEITIHKLEEDEK